MNNHSISSLQKHKFICLSLYSKYNITITKYNYFKFTILLLNKTHHLSLISKEQGIDDCFEDYLKRYYYSTESFIRIPQMAAYYKNYLIIFGVPTFCNLILNSQIHSYATKKAEIYYNNHCHKDEEKISSLESNSNINVKTNKNPEHKPGIILTQTMIQTIENKSEQSSVSLVFNEQEVTSEHYKKHSPISKEESLLSILLMIDPVTDVLKDKMKKISNTLNTKRSTNNKISTVDKTKTAKEELNDCFAEKAMSNTKEATKKSRNRNLNSCCLLNTINANNELVLPAKAKLSKKYHLSMVNNPNDFRTFFHQINSVKIQQLVKHIKGIKNQKDKNVTQTKRTNMPHNSPDKSRSNSKKKNSRNLTRTFKQSDFTQFTFQAPYVALNEYNTLKSKHTFKSDSSNNNNNNNSRYNHKSYFSLTTKNMPIYINNNERQSTQENAKSSLTITNTEKSKNKTKSKHNHNHSKPLFNTLNLNAKTSNYYLRKTKTKTKPKCKEFSLNKETILKSYSHIKDSALNISKPFNLSQKGHIINTYFNKKKNLIDKAKHTHSKEYNKPICYLMTQQDNNYNHDRLTKPLVKTHLSKETQSNLKTASVKNASNKKIINQISNISLTKKKTTSITLEILKCYGIGTAYLKQSGNK